MYGTIKHLLILLIIFILCVSLAACKKLGVTENAEIDYGNSNKFSEDEIESAVDIAMDHFRDNFQNCELIKIWYDEEVSDTMVYSYLTYGHGAFGHGISKVKSENVIGLLFDFYVEPRGAKPYFEPDTMYCGWNMILIKDSKTDKWAFRDGYGG